MPIKIQRDLPAKAILESENIFVMDEDRARTQDIRPLEILILNLMPIKEETETQLLRALSNTPLQIDCTFLMLCTHVSKNTSASHIGMSFQRLWSGRKSMSLLHCISAGEPRQGFTITMESPNICGIKS